MASGIGFVVVATHLPRNHVRKVKQADMKIAVTALLFSFATFWFGEAVVPIDHLILVPLLAFYLVVVYKMANRASPEMAVAPEVAATGGATGPAVTAR